MELIVALATKFLAMVNFDCSSINNISNKLIR